jgi:uncharacterized membrane protein HdeD (DUF308 family)
MHHAKRPTTGRLVLGIGFLVLGTGAILLPVFAYQSTVVVSFGFGLTLAGIVMTAAGIGLLRSRSRTSK